MPIPQKFDRRFFDRWYRRPGDRVRTPMGLRRQAQLAAALAESVLDRPLRSALDVGCGEGAWEGALRRLRPRVRYDGVDPSPYVLRRLAGRRVRTGTFSTLGEIGLRGPYDLVICSSVAQYLTAAELVRGLRALRSLAGGVMHLEIFTARDEVDGDVRGRLSRSARWYRAQLHRSGFRAIGLHYYVGPIARPGLAEMEVGQ